jgi:cell division protein FtsQ
MSKDEFENNDDSLTPWERENKKYLEKRGENPIWEESPHFSHHKKNEPEEVEEQEPVEEEETAEPVEETPEEPAEVEYESFTKKLPKLKKQRDKRVRRRLTIIVSISVVLILGLVYYVSPLSKLGAISVVNNESVSKEEIIKSSKLKTDDSLWSQYFSRKTNERAIVKQNKRVKSAKISLSGINNFKIKIVNFKEIAYEKVDKGYVVVLESGTVMSDKILTDKDLNKSLPTLEGFNSKDDKVMEVIKEYNQIDAKIRTKISNIKYTPSKVNPDLVTLNMNDGNQVLISSEDMKTKLKYYDQVAGNMQEKGVIDMEVGIYSYPFSMQKEEQESSETKDSKTEDSSTEDSSSEEDANAENGEATDNAENQENSDATTPSSDESQADVSE